MQKHIFIMDPLEKLNLKLDSSLKLAFEMQNLGLEVYAADIHDLFWNSRQECCQVKAARLFFQDGPQNVSRESSFQALLSEFAGIHMRKEPPFDISYVASTWLLESAEKQSLVFNKPSALRTINEKAAILQFPHLIENALISYQADDIIEFIEGECNGDGIVKPLTLYGGKGIFRIQSSEQNIIQRKELIHKALTHSQPLLVQAFNKHIFAGEVRAFAMGGEVLAWCLKKPHEGNFFANTSAGATLHPYKPSEEFAAKINTVSRTLYEKGVSFVGFDLIGESISEINITSPRLLQAEEDKANYYERIARWVQKRCGSNVIL